jgi:hypothetical protein
VSFTLSTYGHLLTGRDKALAEAGDEILFAQ